MTLGDTQRRFSEMNCKTFIHRVDSDWLPPPRQNVAQNVATTAYWSPIERHRLSEIQ